MNFPKFSSQSSRNDILPLALALLTTVGILGGTGWLGISYLRKVSMGTGVSLPNRTKAPEAGSISMGDRSLVLDEGGDRAPAMFYELKAAGIAAFKQKHYFEAVFNFEAALEIYPNAPETLIYLNNARIGRENAVEVAVIAPISGSNPHNALEMLRGFAQLQQEVNEQGGINGLPLRLHIADDGDDPEVARTLGSQFASQSTVQAVVGHWTSDVSLAAAEVYNDHGLPFVTPISTTNELSSAGRYSFRTALTNAAGGQALAEVAKSAWNIDKVAIFYAEDVTYSEEIRQQFSQTFTQERGEVVAQFDLTSSHFQARQAVTQAIDAGAEALLIAPNNASLDRSLQVIQANQGRLRLLGDLANLYSPKILDLGPDAEGLVMALSWSIDQPNARFFVERSQALWRADVNYATANSYDALQAVTEAMEPAWGRQPIATELKQLGFASQGAGNPVSFKPSGDRQLTPQLVTVQQATTSRSGTGYDFVAINSQEPTP